MATVKLKFRASTVKGKSGVLYYQIIQQRVTRQIPLDFVTFLRVKIAMPENQGVSS
jgi:hypothetical protein